MIETPLTAVLDREESKRNATQHFADQIALLKDLADYGSNLIIRSFNSSAKDVADIVVCGVLLKQVVAMLDASCVLVGEGTVQAAYLPARSAFEASVYLEWILFSDAERKATAYIVGNFRDERIWAARVTKGTPEEAIFESIAKTIGLDIHARRPTLAGDAQRHLAEVNRILEQEGLRAMDQEFEIARGKRRYDPEWYELCGVKSIRRIAQSVGRVAEYEFFYSKGSRITHTASYKDHVRFVNKHVHFKPIRTLEGIDELLNFTVGTAIRTFQNVIRYYRPGELDAFGRKYVEDWRAPFVSIKSVRYNYADP